MTTVIDPHIARAARFLSRSHPEWGTIDGAYAECRHASSDLQRYLEDLGYRSEIIPLPVLHLKDPHPRWEPFRGREHCIAHYGVHVDGLFIDLTARQFDATAPFPRILHTWR